MTVLAASICARNGKVLVSRQFISMSRARIEALLASFIKLLPSSSGSQHTTVATDDVRFVYQPLEDMFLVLTTTLMSNILQDIDLLQLFSRAVADTCGNRRMCEAEVSTHAFELLHVFDELVANGLPECLGLTQLRAITSMESNEERIQELITRNKELEAREQMRIKAKKLELDKKAASVAAARAAASAAGNYGIAGGAASSTYSIVSALLSPTGRGSSSHPNTPRVGGGSDPTGTGMMHSSSFTGGRTSPTQSNYTAATMIKAAGGMRLGSGGGSGNGSGGGSGRRISGAEYAHDLQIIAAAATSGIMGVAGAPGLVLPATAAAPELAPVVEFTEPVHVVIDEVVSATVSRDGGVQSFEVRGEMTVHASAGGEQARIKVERQAQHGALQFKVHPSFDRTLWASESVLRLRDARGGFVPGQPYPALKWRLAGPVGDSSVPISFSCWTSAVPGSRAYDITIEYELNSTNNSNHSQDQQIGYADLTVQMPCRVPPSVTSASCASSQHNYDIAARAFTWAVPKVTTEAPTGSIELRADGEDPSEFFPMRVSMTSSQLYAGLRVSEVTAPDGTEPITFGVTCTSRADDYQIV